MKKCKKKNVKFIGIVCYCVIVNLRFHVKIAGFPVLLKHALQENSPESALTLIHCPRAMYTVTDGIVYFNLSKYALYILHVL